MRRNFWINHLFFQLAWPACVVGAAYGLVWPALIWVGLFGVWQLHPKRAHPNDWLLVGLFVLTGLVLDLVWIHTGLLTYSMAWPWSGITPVWLLMLWVALALSVNHSLVLFRKRWLLWSMILSVASPFSYWFAAQLGAVEWLAQAWIVVFALGPVWGFIVGLLFYLAHRMDASLTDQNRGLKTTMETASQ